MGTPPFCGGSLQGASLAGLMTCAALSMGVVSSCFMVPRWPLSRHDGQRYFPGLPLRSVSVAEFIIYIDCIVIIRNSLHVSIRSAARNSIASKAAGGGRK